MTDAEIKEYYSNLLILQYRGKPKAKATVEATIDAMISGQIFSQIENGFDPNTAVGVMLDIIGKYVGVDRYGYSFSGPVILGDNEYRSLVLLKIIINNSDTSLYSVQEMIDLFFKNVLFVFDYMDMSISYYFNSSFGSQELVEVFVNKNLLPRPMGVQLGSVIYHPDLLFFGFRTYQKEAVNSYPFNSYDEYNETWTWLSYGYAINSPTKLDEVLLLENGIDNLITEDGQDIIT